MVTCCIRSLICRFDTSLPQALLTACGLEVGALPLVLCVSGGSDSVAMLLLVSQAFGIRAHSSSLRGVPSASRG